MTKPKYHRVARVQPLSFAARRWLLGDDACYWGCRPRPGLSPPRVDLLWAEHGTTIVEWHARHWPGSRPARFWQYASKPRRKRETETAYLSRTNMWLPGEREAFQRATSHDAR